MQVALSKYIKLQYPDVIFTSESSGVRVNMGQAVKMKNQRSVGKLPDMIILEPRFEIGLSGLILELKDKDNSPFLKDGSLSTKKKIQEQAQMLDRLKHKGYSAQFVVGLDEAIRIVDLYMNK